jgi:hypothetical protein
MFPEVRKLDIKIFQGTSLLNETGYFQNDRAYIPCEAVESYSGLWGKGTVFLNSPLAGKTICLAVLSSNAGPDHLPPALEGFLNLCTAAGANITYYDGSGFPTGDFILAIEPGGSQTGVKYLGTAYGSRPLARKIAANFKQGLRLAYLPDPIPFNKPYYNLKLKLRTRLFTPAVAVQWPRELDLGPWLFTSLMGYADGSTMDASDFSESEAVYPDTPDIPDTPDTPSTPDPLPLPIEEPTPPQELHQPSPQVLPQDNGEPWTISRQPRRSAALSQVMYPHLFSDQNKKIYKKDPFS